MGHGSLTTALTGGFNHGLKEGLITTASGGSNQFYAKAKGDPSLAGTTDPFNLAHPNTGNPALDYQIAQDAARKQQIADTTAAVNKVYDSPERQAQYNDFINAVRAKNNQDLSRQQTIANLQTKFATARNGLTGGSRDVDAQRLLGQEYQQGVLSAEQKAQGALAGLKNSDNSSRLQLIQLAQQGLGATDAAARAEAGSQADAQNALSNATVNGLGDMFAGTTAAYQANQQAAALREGRTAPLGSLYGKPGF